MLSILIPIYNNDIRKLVVELNSQCQKANISYEIICFDDWSKESYKKKNSDLGQLMNTSYIELWKNHGRAKIRNLLASNARYDWLLFLDSDSKLKSKRFIKKYIESLNHNSECINGGRVYTKQRPKSINKQLHWLYGSKIESQNASLRNKKPVSLFHSNNFMIRKEVFDSIQFDEDIDGYGYEDLCFAFALKKKGFKIEHVTNPVLHANLETSEDFLNKTKGSIRNLVTLYNEKKIMRTKLIKYVEMLKSTRTDGIYLKWYSKNEETICTNLISVDPSLYKFNLYKLGEYLKEEERRTKNVVE